MKNIFIPLFLVFLLMACSDGLLEDVNEISTDEISLRGDKITVCHYSKAKGGTWSELEVNVNAVPGHRGHGDAVDMDGDGYYDIANGCGPVDCDDTDAGYTDNCCQDYCVFCDHTDYYRLNFTDCIDGRSNDWHESHTEDYRGCDYYGCDDFVSASAVIFDAEGRYSPDCDGDPSTWHFGYIYATTYTYCDVVYSSSSFHYTDSEGAFIFDRSDLTPEQALSCIAAIEKIAFDLGLENIGKHLTCDDLFQQNTSGLKRLKSNKELASTGKEPLSMKKLLKQMNHITHIKGN